MSSASLKQLFDELTAVVLDAQAAGRGADATTPAAGVSAAAPDTAADPPPARVAVSQMLDRGTAYVREHPWQALGVAAVAGLLAGLALRRK